MRFFRTSGIGRAATLALVTTVVMLAGANAWSQGASIFDRNLVVNGDAEAGPGTPDAGSPAMPPPGWKTTSNFTAAQYGGSGGLPAKTDPGPADRGVNFFSGGNGNAASWARQRIDVGAGAAAIDAGTVRYKLWAFLGGFSGQEDHTVISATFVDAGGRDLGVATIGPVTAADRKNTTGLLPRGAAGALPAKTRSVDILIAATRFEGGYNDGYSDNILFSLAK